MQRASCQDFSRVVDRYLAEALAPDVHLAMEYHLLICESCTNYLDSFLDTIRMVRSLGTMECQDSDQDKVPEGLIQDILRGYVDYDV